MFFTHKGKIKYLVLILLGFIMNLLFYLSGLSSFNALLFRFSILFIVLVIVLLLNKKWFLIIEDYKDYLKYIDKTLSSRVWILKYEHISFVIFGISLLIFLVYPTEVIILYNVTFWALISSILTFMSVLEYRKLTNEKKRKNSFDKGQKRFFPSEVLVGKTALFYCHKCVQLGVTVTTIGIGAPKLIYGFNYRPPLANFIAKPFTGITSSSEACYSTALHLLERDSTLLSKITLEDGHTVTWTSLKPYLYDESFVANQIFKNLSK